MLGLISVIAPIIILIISFEKQEAAEGAKQRAGEKDEALVEAAFDKAETAERAVTSELGDMCFKASSATKPKWQALQEEWDRDLVAVDTPFAQARRLGSRENTAAIQALVDKEEAKIRALETELHLPVPDAVTSPVVRNPEPAR